MDSAGSSNAIIKDEEKSTDKRDIKPVPKTLNRVPRKLLKNLSLELSFCSVHQIKGACVSKMTLSAIRFSRISISPECLQKTKDEMRGC